MSGLYVYCITGSGHHPAEGLLGIDSAMVDSASLDPFTVWVSPLGASPEPTVGRVQQHDAVVRRAARDGEPVLPVRFGQYVATVEPLRRHLEEARAEYEASLDVVRGAVEFGLRVLDHEGAADPVVPSFDTPVSGREHLRNLADAYGAKRDRRERAEEEGRKVQEWLGPLVRSSRAEPWQCTGGVAVLAHLVAREDVDTYREAVRRMVQARPQVRILSTGPWPPYSFTP